MAFTGYSNSGKTYSIGSSAGINFISDAPSGSVLTGGDGSLWRKNADGSTTITKGSDVFNVGEAAGNFQNQLDLITAQSDKTSAQSNEYAREQREWSANQAAIANEFNASEAAKNRDWQSYMSNTAHQREVQDLLAAGLNPVLSASGGNGAAVTSGATANALLPSGQAGQADQSRTQAVISFLGSLLNAQTQILNTAVSARTNEAVAEKYTSMSWLTAQLQAEVSRGNIDKQTAAMIEAALISQETGKYSADTSYATSDLSSKRNLIASIISSLFSVGGKFIG